MGTKLLLLLAAWMGLFMSYSFEFSILYLIKAPLWLWVLWVVRSSFVVISTVIQKLLEGIEKD